MRIRDWSSDVCSSDLPRAVQAALSKAGLTAADVDKFIFPTTLKGVEGQLAKSLGIRADAVVGNLASQVGDTGVGHGLLMLAGDRKSVVEGKSVSVRVDLGGRGLLKKKKNKNQE